MTTARRRVRIDYVAQYPNPIQGRVGQSVTVVRRDSRYPEWVWCSGPERREGWVPLVVLKINEEDAVLVRDYDARELTVTAGDDVDVHEEIGGWLRVSSADGRTGWIPAHCLTLAPGGSMVDDKVTEGASPVQAHRDLLVATYAAFNARDLARALAAMHPDVDWPNGMEGGYVRGRDGIRDYWTRQWAQIDPHVAPTRMNLDDTGRIVVDVHQVVRDLSGSLLVDRMVQHVYTIDEGLIRHMEIRD